MFPLSDGKLIRLNTDGSCGEIIHSTKPKMVFGTSILYDHHIKDIDPTNEVSCEISTDEYGRVSGKLSILHYLCKKIMKIMPKFDISEKKFVVYDFVLCFLAPKTCLYMFLFSFNRFQLLTNRPMRFS